MDEENHPEEWKWMRKSTLRMERRGDLPRGGEEDKESCPRKGKRARKQRGEQHSPIPEPSSHTRSWSRQRGSPAWGPPPFCSRPSAAPTCRGSSGRCQHPRTEGSNTARPCSARPHPAPLPKGGGGRRQHRVPPPPSSPRPEPHGHALEGHPRNKPHFGPKRLSDALSSSGGSTHPIERPPPASPPSPPPHEAIPAGNQPTCPAPTAGPPASASSRAHSGSWTSAWGPPRRGRSYGAPWGGGEDGAPPKCTRGGGRRWGTRVGGVSGVGDTSGGDRNGGGHQ